MTAEAPQRSHPKPQLVVTLPGRTPDELRHEFRRASEAGADLVEVRLDRIPAGDVEGLATIHQIPMDYEWIPAILTLRSRSEGGEGPDEETARLSLLQRALEVLPFTYVDLELARDLRIARSLRDSYGRNLGQIFSAHLVESTPLGLLRKTLRDSLEIGSYGKVVLPATVGRTLGELVPLAREFAGQHYVLHTTGPSGPLLRVLAAPLGMGLVYASLPGDGSRTVEPSQLPADRMRSFLDAMKGTPWLAVVGHPIRHSRSPLVHHRFLEQVGLPWLYVALDLVEAEEFRPALTALKTLGLRGVNVTLPYKELAAELADLKEEEVVTSGAANTLAWETGSPGALHAFNTDVSALARILTEVGEEGWSGESLLVLGAGGASRAVIAAGVEQGAHVFVTGRDRARVERTVQDFPSEFVSYLPPDALRPEGLVVNATPVGMAGSAPLSVPLEKAFRRGGILLDLVYSPADPFLRRAAEQAGVRYLGGGRMLVYQAAESFERFTGRKAPQQLMSELVREVDG